MYFFITEDVLALLKNLKVANQMLGDKDGTPATVAERTQGNKLVLHKPAQSLSEVRNSAGNFELTALLLIFSVVSTILKC